jgi:hypothetical protein
MSQGVSQKKRVRVDDGRSSFLSKQSLLAFKDFDAEAARRVYGGQVSSGCVRMWPLHRFQGTLSEEK